MIISTMFDGILIGSVLGFSIGTGFFKMFQPTSKIDSGVGALMAFSNLGLLLYLNGML